MKETFDTEKSLSDIFCSDAVLSEVLSFLQQLETLQTMIHNVEDSFPDLIFAMATTGKQPMLQIILHLAWFLVYMLVFNTTHTRLTY